MSTISKSVRTVRRYGAMAPLLALGPKVKDYPVPYAPFPCGTLNM